VSSLAEIIGAGVDDNGALRSIISSVLSRGLNCGRGEGRTYADNAVWADELDQSVGDGADGVALGISLEVTEIANVTLLVGWGTVVLALGVDCCDALAGILRTLWLWLRRGGGVSQWGPAEVQPLVLSPNWWTWMPRSALASLPVMFHEMVVFEFSSACSKVTVPVTLESPRSCATAERVR
jgi:hypothetical protein